MNSKIKLDDNYYLENGEVIFENTFANVVLNAQQVHAIELLFKEYNGRSFHQNK